MRHKKLVDLSEDDLRTLVRDQGYSQPYIDEVFRRVPALGALHAAYLAALQGDEDDYMTGHPNASLLDTVEVPATGASTQVRDLYRDALNAWVQGWQSCRHCESRIRPLGEEDTAEMDAAVEGRTPRPGDWIAPEIGLVTGLDCPGTDDRRHEPRTNAT